ncbi:MAG: cytochrome c peroxidase [Gemmatimonadota bacterium]|nr:cytochrome c peroxidase [Gemmatimonadota bacterium]
MKTRSYLFTLACAAAMGACGGTNTDAVSTPGATTASDDARAMQTIVVWRAHVDTLAHRIAQLDSAAVALRTDADVPRVRTAFVDARRAFKLAELALEYYTPTTAKEMNGPALPEVDDEEGPEAVFPPTGFQVIEEALYGDAPVSEREAITRETGTLRPLVTRAQTMMGAQHASDAHVWDAVKLELARIATLGLPGFDSPVAGHSLAEADVALESIVRSLAPYRTADSTWSHLDSLLAEARTMLLATSDRDTFDHFTFLSQRLIPLGRAMQQVRLSMAIGVPAERRAFRMDAATVFDSAAFDVMGFAPIDATPGTPAQIALGERLFHDTQLSGDGTRACSSCHMAEKAFTDGLAVNRARGGAPLARNTPTVINSGLQLGSFADLRTTYLEDQVTDVVENVDEMHGSLSRIAARLATDTSVVARFRVAFTNVPAHTDSVVTAAQIRTVLAAYQRSLTRLNSPVDRALRGDVAALSDQERRGFNVFVGKGKCATCHFIPLTNGTVPPAYRKAEVEVLGTPSRAVIANATIDPDLGRYRLTRAEPHRYAFKTPSLRNVALTAPYMHNGVYRTLEAVVDFYNRGGGAGIGIQLDHQTLPPDPLRLTTTEQRDLVAFMRALTDTTGTQRR